MLWFEVIVGLVVLLALGVAISRGATFLDDEAEDVADDGIPEGRLLRSDDIARLRFRVALRGYRMGDVDRALEAARLALQAAEGHDVRPPARRHPPLVAEQPPGSDRALSELEEDAAAAPEES